MSVYDRIPNSAHAANEALGDRRFVALDTQTRLVRGTRERVSLRYRGVDICTWSPEGHLRIYPHRWYGQMPRPMLKRLSAALPDEWEVEFRPRTINGRARAPRLRYRETWVTDLTVLTFRADGGLEWGSRNVYPEDIMTRTTLDREVSTMQGFEPWRSRRSPNPPVPVQFDAPLPEAPTPTRRRRPSDEHTATRARRLFGYVPALDTDTPTYEELIAQLNSLATWEVTSTPVFEGDFDVDVEPEDITVGYDTAALTFEPPSLDDICQRPSCGRRFGSHSTRDICPDFTREDGAVYTDYNRTFQRAL